MKFAASAVCLALAASSVSAGPVERRQPIPSGVASAVPAAASSSVPSQQQAVIDAVNAWRSDTGEVSNFLNVANDLNPSDDELKSDATSALASEKDELTHKAVLDAVLCGATDSNGCTQVVDGSGGLSDANSVSITLSGLSNPLTLLRTWLGVRSRVSSICSRIWQRTVSLPMAISPRSITVTTALADVARLFSR